MGALVASGLLVLIGGIIEGSAWLWDRFKDWLERRELSKTIRCY